MSLPDPTDAACGCYVTVERDLRSVGGRWWLAVPLVLFALVGVAIWVGLS